jgi:hypothetical protein
MAVKKEEGLESTEPGGSKECVCALGFPKIK